MAYTSTYDEKSTGFFSLNASYYLDAAPNLNTSFYIAAGSFNSAYGLLGTSGYFADTDVYRMGTLAAGTYSVSASSSYWFYGVGYASYITPTVGVYNSSGALISGGGVTSTSFTVSSSGDYYIGVTGVTYSSSQYSVSYTYTPPINYPANSGTLAIVGTLATGNALSISGNFTDANGLNIANATAGYVYTWYISADNSNWTAVSTSASYQIQAQDVGKYIDCLITFRDDAGNAESVSPPGLLIPALVLSPTYRLSPVSPTMNEGATDNVTLQTTNLTAGSTVTYAISGIAASRLSSGVLSGTLTIDANGQALIPFSVLNDNFTDGTTVATITVGANLASTAITIIDTSLTPVGTQLTPVSITNLNTTYTVTTPNLAITGTSGNDTVAFSGSHSNFSVSIANGKATVVDKTGALGTDTFTSVERIKFSDGVYALDIAPGQNAGQAYRLYQAAFARTPDIGGLKYHLNDMEANTLPLWQIASNFLASPEFASKYGSNPTDTQYINALYKNVLNRNPGASEVSWYQNQFNTKAMDRQAALIGFSESPENVALVGSAIANGIWLG
jgi:hypothetical protein